MIRTLAIVLTLSTSFVVFSAMDASAQTTEQTDRSEEDWRKSKKKRDTSDIFEDILNRGSTGQGSNQYPQNPVDSLPEDSRRHVMKERAKVIAESEPGETPDALYKPSEAAQTDPDLAEQEKEAWDVIMTDMKGGNSQGHDQGQGGSGPNKVAVTGQGGGQNDGNNSSSSPMRGGSSQSVADIMAQIKGLKSGDSNGTSTATSQSPQRTESGSQAPSGQSQLGQGRNNDQSLQKQASQGESQAQEQAKSASEAQDQTRSQNKSDQHATAEPEANTQAGTAEKTKQSIESIGPLERIKRVRKVNNSDVETSASDFLKRAKDSK